MVFVCVLVYMRITHHIVGDGWKHYDGDDAVGNEIGKDFGQEVDGSAVVTTGILMTTKDINKDCQKTWTHT